MSDAKFPDPSSKGSFRFVCDVFQFFASNGELAVLEALKEKLALGIEVAKRKLEEPIEITPQMEKLFSERLEDFRRNPNQGSSWEEVRQRLFESRREEE